jgi:mannose-6-phosphate isomerase-like protein (cupin superfamily)
MMSTEPTVIAPGGGEVIGDAPDRRVEILADHDGLHATWSRFAPGREGADLHIHRRHTDLFYVLAGELTVRLGHAGDEITVGPGTLVRVPPLVVHGFRNAGEAELRYLNFHAPGQGFADYMRALRDGRTLVYDQEPPPASGTRPPGDAVVGEAAVESPEISIALRSLDGGEAAGGDEARATSLYVLDGELTVVAGSRRLHADAGAWVQIPPGVAYTCEGEARVLEVRVPG